MSYDENRISDQIDGGLNEKEQMQKHIEELESKLQAVKDSLYTDEEITDIVEDYIQTNGMKHHPLSSSNEVISNTGGEGLMELQKERTLKALKTK